MSKFHRYFLLLIIGITLYTLIVLLKDKVNESLIYITTTSLILILINKIVLYKKDIEVEKNMLSLKSKELKIYFDNPIIGFLSVDKKRDILDVNPLFCEMLGYERSELIGKSSDIFDISIDYYEDLFKAMFLKNNSKENLVFRYRMKQKSAKLIWVEISGSLLDYIQDSNNSSIVWIVKDITQLIKDERTIYTFNSELASKVDYEVAKNMAQREKYEEERLKDAKFTAIGQLSAGITHEINTPLTYVKGNLEMMSMDIDDIEDISLKDQFLENYNNIEDGISRIVNIVDSMREMAQSNKEAKEKVNIYTTLITSLVLAHNRAKQVVTIFINGIEFTLNNKKDKFECFATIQKQRIEQVWIIIINNALDELVKIDSFSEREFNIFCTKDEENVSVKFVDNAGGIDSKIIDKIFEPFISNKTHGGMGVGLSIAKKIIDDQGGELTAYNLNNGSVFEVKLPIDNS